MRDRFGLEKLRVDLFLKRARLVKRRSLASKLCGNGWVTLNGRLAPPGKSVRVGDEIAIRYPREKVIIRVEEIPATPAKGQSCYTVISSEKIEEEIY